MTTDIWITFGIVVGIVVLFIWNRVPVVIVALGTALALYFTGVLTLQQSLAGLGDTSVVFIASLFVVSAGLEAAGVSAWAGQFLVAKAGDSRTRLMVIMMLLVAGMTALISVNGAVAALLPVVVVTAVRLGRPTSQLLMPLVFASHAGSMLALTGTPVNVLVSEAAVDAGYRSFRYFEFAMVGVPLLAGTMLIAVLFGRHLLPTRNGRSIPADLSRHGRTLVEQYRLNDGVFQLRVRASSPLAGAAPTAVDLSAYPGLSLMALQSGADGGPVRGPALREGDVVTVRGDAESVAGLAADMHLGLRGATGKDGGSPAEDAGDGLFNKRSGLAEVVIPPRSKMIGEVVHPGMVTPSGDLVILAVQRAGEVLPVGEATLVAGDTLLLQGTWEALDVHLDDPEVLVVNPPETVRQQAIPMGTTAGRALAVLAGMVLLLATGLLPSVIAGLLAACAMVVLGVVRVEQAYRGINWTTVILIGGMMPLSTAMSQTGAAQLLADGLVAMVGGAGPYALLAGLFLLTAILGQLISNTATALIIIPIAVAAATDLGLSPQPVLMSVTVAAAAAFLTPVATPVNLMVMAPGGYKFGDYWKLGLAMMTWFFLVATFVVPMIWTFR